MTRAGQLLLKKKDKIKQLWAHLKDSSKTNFTLPEPRLRPQPVQEEGGGGGKPIFMKASGTPFSGFLLGDGLLTSVTLFHYKSLNLGFKPLVKNGD